MLTLDYQEATQRCEHCAKDYPVSRGSIYESGKPVAIYLAGLHPCSSGGSAIFAVGVAPEDPRGKAQSFSIQVWLVNDQYQMSLLGPEKSPWRTHGYRVALMRSSRSRTADSKEGRIVAARLKSASRPARSIWMAASSASPIPKLLMAPFSVCALR